MKTKIAIIAAIVTAALVGLALANMKCPVCKGSGWDNQKKCTFCDGKGNVGK